MPATAACAEPRSPVYRRRQPERTLLYRTVQTHLATWLALHDDGQGTTAPAATEREFRRYLDCGPSTGSGQAFSPTALPAPVAPTAGTTFSSPTPASVAACVRPAPPGAWSRPQPISPTTSSRICRYGITSHLHGFIVLSGLAS